jgi:glutamine---fructose-6-phosphate transaminase (isomerizing)
MPSLMMQSILEQPEAMRRLLGHRPDLAPLAAAIRERRVRKVWLTGSGTSLFAAMIAARSWEHGLLLDCEAVSALEFVEDELRRVGSRDLVVAISQSGASLTLLEAVRQARSAGALTLVVTADPAAPVPAASEFVIDCFTGEEKNLGKSKGFTTTALAAVLVGAGLARSLHGEGATIIEENCDLLPDAFTRAIGDSASVVKQAAERFARADALYVVGSGSTVPTALEGALKILEVAKMPVLAKDLEEMMHGPYNGVGPDTGIVIIADQTVRRDRLDRFLSGTRLIGTSTLTITAPAGSEAPVASDLALPPLTDPALRAILAVVPFQLLAENLAAARGVPIDQARYPQLYPVFASKSIHL